MNENEKPNRLGIVARTDVPLFAVVALNELLMKDPAVLRDAADAIGVMVEGVAKAACAPEKRAEINAAGEVMKILCSLTHDIAGRIDFCKRNAGFYECVAKLASDRFPVVGDRMIVPPRILDAALAAASGNKIGKVYEGECHACTKFYSYTGEKINVNANAEMSVKCPHCGVDDWIGKMPPPPPECFAPATGGTQ